MTLWSVCVCNRKTLERFFVAGNYLSICSPMCRWRDESREAILEDLATQANSLVDLQGGQRKSATKADVQTSMVVTRTNKGLKLKINSVVL